jgi:hypothetical protein
MGRSSSDDESDDSRRGRRDKRDKSKRDKSDKKRDKSDKRDKRDKKDKKRSRRSRSRTPEKKKPTGFGAGLLEFDVNKALVDNEDYLQQIVPSEQSASIGPDGVPRLGLDAATKNVRNVEAPKHPMLKPPEPSSGTSTALTLAGPLSLMAPNSAMNKKLAMANTARESRRIHVSHVPRHWSTVELKQYFQRLCATLRREMIREESGKEIPPEASVDIDHVIDVFINTNGAIPFAFIELSTDDMCTKLITGDVWVEFPLPTGGVQKVKCRRPRDYRTMAEQDDRRVIMLGLADPESQAGTFEELFKAVGEVENFAPIPGRGFYAEFLDPSKAKQAVNMLHGQVIGDHVVTLQFATEAVRAHLLSLGLPVTGMSDDENGPSRNLAKDLVGDLLNAMIPLTQPLENFAGNHEHLRSWPMVLPTRILCIFNCFERAELEDDESYDNLVMDVEEEVEKYGRVKRLIIPRNIPPPPLPPDEYVPPPRPRPPTTAFELLPLRNAGYTGANGGGGSALMDPTGMSDAQFRIDTERWEAEVKAGEKEYEAQLSEFAKRRAVWEQECVHPVFGMQSLGRIFVEYETVDEAENAQRHISGRLFNGRTVITSFLFEDVLYPPKEEETEGAAAPDAEETREAPNGHEGTDAAGAGDNGDDDLEPPRKEHRTEAATADDLD